MSELLPNEVVAEWFPLETAPRDGSEIIGLYDGQEVEIRWARERQCMMAGYAGGHGYFGPGWEDTYNTLIAEPPEAWRPLAALDVSKETT